jgi:uncharacterized membrane protein YkvA (DUF1232 family)
MAAKKSKVKPDTQDDFYKRLRERVSRWASSSSINPKYRDYVLALPDLFHLVVKLSWDKRVDLASKAVLGAAIAWALVPFDILPDVLGPIGMLDDLLVLVLALDFMLDRTPRSVIQEHWAGSGDVFALIRNVLDRADEWMGRGLVQKIRSMMTRGMTGKASRAARASSAAPKAARGGRRRTTSAAAPKRASAARASSAAASKAAPKASAGTRATKKRAAKKTAARRTRG